MGVEAIEDETAGVIAYGSLRLPGHEKQTSQRSSGS
jgi:hypothetical protein